jgi:hypothetical protein
MSVLQFTPTIRVLREMFCYNLEMQLERAFDRGRTANLVQGIEAAKLGSGAKVVFQICIDLPKLRRAQVVDRAAEVPVISDGRNRLGFAATACEKTYRRRCVMSYWIAPKLRTLPVRLHCAVPVLDGYSHGVDEPFPFLPFLNIRLWRIQIGARISVQTSHLPSAASRTARDVES